MTKESVCPQCGEPSTLGLCDRCRLAMATLLECPDSVEVTICPLCGSQLIRGRWQDAKASVEELITEAVAEKIGIHQDLADPKVEISVSQLNATQYLVDVHLSGTFGELAASGDCIVRAKAQKATCERCSRMAGNYYEATVQVRGSAGAPGPDELKMSRKIAEEVTASSFERGDRLSFIQEIKGVKGGMDLVVGSTQQGRSIARAIHERFGGSTQESYKLAGTKDGKSVYRTSILVRLPSLKAGDLIRTRGAFLEVRGFEGKRTVSRSLRDGATFYLSPEEAEDAVLVGNRSSAERGVVVAADRDVLEVLDPQSYRTVSASRPCTLAAEAGDEVEFLRFRGDLVILPPRDG